MRGRIDDDRVKRIVKLRSLVKNRKFFCVSPRERQTKGMRVSRMMRMNLSILDNFTSEFERKSLVLMGVHLIGELTMNNC